MQPDKPYPTSAFIANYDYQTPTGAIVKQTWYSDGQGKVRLEVNDPVKGGGGTVIDYTNRTAMAIFDKPKTIIKLDFAQTPVNFYVNSHTAKEKGFEDLGTKTIKGHECHGWKLPEKYGGHSMWVEDATGMLVESVRTTSNGELKATLTDSKLEQPDSALFIAPAGYTVLEPPG